MKGDFIGFSFDGVHCSELGITRVSDGDRYDEELFPEINDRSSEIIGENGENYFGSEYRAKSFPIKIAFDSITETQFRRIRRLFGTKKICNLIFDERPYKVYRAKLESPIELNYVCFEEDGYTWEKLPIEGTDEYYKGVTGKDYEYKKPTGKKQRIYKGEGTIDLIAYYPFAKQQYKKLEEYESNYTNIDEWAESSGLLTTTDFNTHNIDKTIDFTGARANFNLEIPVYNPGDIDAGFYLYIPFNGTSIAPDSGNYVRVYGDNNGLLLRPIIRKLDKDTGIIINTVNHLIEGVNYHANTQTWKTTGSLYNECIAAGDFPRILRSDWYFDNDQFKQAIYLNYQVDTRDKGLIQIFYDYLYF